RSRRAVPGERPEETCLMVRQWKTAADRRVDAVALLTAACDDDVEETYAAVLDVLSLEQTKRLAATVAFWLLEEMERNARLRGHREECVPVAVRDRLVGYGRFYAREALREESERRRDVA